MTVRRLRFDSLYNFRDLGGYPAASGATTNWQVVYRADGIQRATDADIDRMESIGVRRVVDLRTSHEQAEDGAFARDHPAIEYLHVPIFESLTDRGAEYDRDAPDALNQLYALMVLKRSDRLAAAIIAIAESGGPVVFHCTAGKDRTGVVAALMLASVGVPDAVIAEDYSLSASAMEQLVAWYRANRPAREGQDAPLQTQAALRMLGAEPEWIADVLALVRSDFGSVDGYLLNAGVDRSTLDRLHEKLIG